MSRQCRGYANSLPIVAPIINGLSTTSSILGATTIVTIFGQNFRNYSTVHFGTTTISNVTFFSSSQLSFYVPSVATVGTYPIQVFNDTLGSNIVNFTIDNSIGFWNQDPITGAITNNNASGGININGQLTVNKPITLNYQPSLVTNNTQLGFIITPTTQAVSTASNISTTILPTGFYTVPQGVWLVSGTTGASCNVAGQTINSINLYIEKNGIAVFTASTTSVGSSVSMPFNIPFISNGTDKLYIYMRVVTVGGGAYTPFAPGPLNTVFLTRIG